MFNGRHCTQHDYLLLEKRANSFLHLLENKDLDAFSSQLENFIDFINQFDRDLGEHLRMKLMFNKGNFDKCIDIFLSEINELKSNVFVDIKEHR